MNNFNINPAGYKNGLRGMIRRQAATLDAGHKKTLLLREGLELKQNLGRTVFFTTRGIKNYALNEPLKSILLEIVATPNSKVEMMNSPDMKPNTPVVKNRPVAMSLYKLLVLFIFAPRLNAVDYNEDDSTISRIFLFTIPGFVDDLFHNCK